MFRQVMSPFSPYIYFGNSPLDRAAEFRTDGDTLRAFTERADVKILAIADNAPLAHAQADRRPRPAWLSAAEARRLIGTDTPDWIFLGRWDDAPYFAVDAANADREAIEAETGAAFTSLRGLAIDGLRSREAAIIAQAKALVDWHERHRFCANCGAATDCTDAGYRRLCPACGHNHFPRTDPVAIVLPTMDDRCLLGRSPHFPENVYSAIAGFIEVGETLEAAAAREVYEEAGVHIDEVVYRFSQPWPFPSTLMIGCAARALTEEITLRDGELADARWFTRAEVAAALAGAADAPIATPPPFAIATQLLGAWLAET